MATLLAGVEIQFIAIIESNKDDMNSRIHRPADATRALHIFAYAALFFSLSTVIFCFLMLDILSEVPTKAWKRYGQGGYPPSALTTKKTSSQLLIDYGADERWRVARNTTFVFAASAIVCTFVQVSIFLPSELYDADDNCCAGTDLGGDVRIYGCGGSIYRIRPTLGGGLSLLVRVVRNWLGISDQLRTVAYTVCMRRAFGQNCVMLGTRESLRSAYI